MKTLVVSDVHWKFGSHNGVYEGNAYDWLLNTVNSVKPTAILGLGDYGHAWATQGWNTLSALAPASLAYGNHDNMEALKGARNPDGTRCLVNDGEIRVVDGLATGFINGILSSKSKMKDGTPRKTAEEYLSYAPRISRVDVLATHMAPREMGSTPLHESDDLRVMESVLKTVKPRLFLCGHLAGPYKIATIGSTVGVRVDSSPAEQHYAVITGKGTVVKVYHNNELVDSVDVPL
ncbi:MAG: metallophosphoesterase family protein [Nitrososphaerota archaeon]|jgi:Icc-related predicted phosphoesterase|nr:metallophosphoesterase family protein [Nitrososphaerota archaeon]MDG6948928.1 metallophosphoesterase family protein [Nitrososphaerota archaeon]